MMKSRTITCVALFCLFRAAPASSAALFEPTLLSDETFGETFTMSVDLGAGAYLQAQLAVSNLGPGDSQGACRVLFVGRDGKEHSAAEKFDRKQWSHQAGANPALRVGPCRLRALDEAVEFDIPLEDAKITARMHAPAASVRPPDARVEVGDSFYETEILVPWAKVEVRVEIDGVSTKRAEGHGLLDHSRSTTLPGKLASRWVRFRVLDPKQGHLFLVRYPPNGAAPRAWAWRAGEESPRSVGQVKVGKKPGKAAPRFRALAKIGGKTWKMTSGALIHRYAPVEKHGMLGKLVGSVVGNPVTYTYVGRLETGGRTLSGLMEVTLLQ